MQFFAFMLLVALSDTYPEHMYHHNHTTMHNQRMTWNVSNRVWSKAWRQPDPRLYDTLTFFIGCMCVCVYLGSLSCPSWVPWPRPSSYIQEAWKQALGHLEGPISSESVGNREGSQEYGDWKTVLETVCVDSWKCVQERRKAWQTLEGLLWGL